MKNDHHWMESTLPMRMVWMVLLCLGAAGLAGCMTVGPDYVPPETALSEQWHTELNGGLSANPPSTQNLARWWSILDDPVLSEFMERAVAGNLSLKEARSRLWEARAGLGVSRANRLPTVDAGGSGVKSRSSEITGSGQEREVYDLGFDAAWELDLFGGVRRSVEAAQANIAAVQASLENTLVSLLAELARNYVEGRILQAQLAIARANLQNQEETYAIVRSRFEAGLSSELPVHQALYNLSGTRSRIPGLETSLETVKNRLAVLMGQNPGQIHAEMSRPLPIPVTPLSVAVGIPADVLRQRPDILQAERLLAAQTARIGVAQAELYPSIRLTGSIGLEALTPGDLFTVESRTWRSAFSINWPIFSGGAIRSNVDIQTARQEQLFYQYQAVVQAALEEVENNLSAYAGEQVRRQALITAKEAAQKAEALAQDQYLSGLIGFNDLLEAQRSVLSFQDQLAQSEGAVTINLIRLYKSLGGGWTRDDEALPGQSE